ncbi:protein shisa-5-like [Gracilinanus agilis]|uniref:protein shisa-5-like n=1 Tax=Gracilinanus agilis TaxID=191870 RepID=UPI001CFD0005|nr:protein shisa-5-like [Gracilinanus agilis]
MEDSQDKGAKMEDGMPRESCGLFDSCPKFCCGSCFLMYCCSDGQNKFDDDILSSDDRSLNWGEKGRKMAFEPDFDSDLSPGFAISVGIGVAIFVLFVVSIILSFMCPCCDLYEMCRRPRPSVVTSSTTVVHPAYPQQPSVPPGCPGAVYQGYPPMPVQPGVPAAPHPTQYPPPCPAQPTGPPAYNEAHPDGAGAPDPISQPPYNPANMDPLKAAY